MHRSLCIVLAVVHCARLRRISPDGGLDSKDRVSYSGNLLHNAAVAELDGICVKFDGVVVA